MPEFDEELDVREEERGREAWDLTPEGIANSNHRLIERQRVYRHAADTAVRALIPFKEVQAVAVFGSVAMPLWKEVPQFDPYRRKGIALWHECPGVDLAVWLDSFKQLSSMRMAILRALARNPGKENPVELDEMAINLLEHGTNRYVGNLCRFRKCPAGKRACQVPGCGALGHLQQFRDYRFDQGNLQPDRCFRLYDRATATINQVIDLPGPTEAKSTGTA